MTVGGLDRPNDRLDREQGHLGVVGDCANAPVGLVEVGDPFWSVLISDLRPPLELGGRAQGVTNRSAEKASTDSFDSFHFSFGLQLRKDS